MNIITGNIKPTDGRVLWDGSEIYGLGERFRSLIGYAPQQQGLYNSFTVDRDTVRSLCEKYDGSRDLEDVDEEPWRIRQE